MDSGTSDHNVAEEMVSLVPQLCRDGVRAEDLVQEALLRAIANLERFTPGTNLKAWLFTIVRNEHYSQLRRRKFEAYDVSTDLLPEPSVPPDHDGELELRDLNRALAVLSPGQRAALILVSASGFSYEEAAAICGCAVGTIKSRVARARTALLAMLEGGLPRLAHIGDREPARNGEATRDGEPARGGEPMCDEPRPRTQSAAVSAPAASLPSASAERRYVVQSSFGTAPSLR